MDDGKSVKITDYTKLREGETYTLVSGGMYSIGTYSGRDSTTGSPRFYIHNVGPRTITPGFGFKIYKGERKPEQGGGRRRKTRRSKLRHRKTHRRRL